MKHDTVCILNIDSNLYLILQRVRICCDNKTFISPSNFNQPDLKLHVVISTTYIFILKNKTNHINANEEKKCRLRLQI